MNVIGIGTAYLDFFFDVSDAFLKKYNINPDDDVIFNQKLFGIVEKTFPVLAKSPGGNTQNTLAVLETLGVRTQNCCVIGKDSYGDFWIDNTVNREQPYIIRAGSMSKCACLLSSGRKKKSFICTLNQRDSDILQTLSPNYLSSANSLVITPLSYSPRQSFQNLIQIIEKVHSPLLSFSPSVVYGAFGITMLLPLIKKTHVLFVSEQELVFLAKKDIRQASRVLVRNGAKIVVCTAGEKGVLVTTSKEQFFAPAKKVKKVIDTTGAGDAFAAGFLYGLLKKQSVRHIVDSASNVAAKSVTDFGLGWIKKA